MPSKFQASILPFSFSNNDILLIDADEEETSAVVAENVVVVSKPKLKYFIA